MRILNSSQMKVQQSTQILLIVLDKKVNFPYCILRIRILKWLIVSDFFLTFFSTIVDLSCFRLA
jgi:hypothetical protein